MGPDLLARDSKSKGTRKPTPLNCSPFEEEHAPNNDRLRSEPLYRVNRGNKKVYAGYECSM